MMMDSSTTCLGRCLNAFACCRCSTPKYSNSLAITNQELRTLIEEKELELNSVRFELAEEKRLRQKPKSKRDGLCSKTTQTDSENNDISEDYVHRIRVQTNQLLNSITCISDIKDVLYQKGKLTPKEMEDITASNWLDACEKILILITKRPRDFYDCFLESLKKTKQDHVYQMLTYADIDMDNQHFSEHNRAIRQTYPVLIENIEPGSLLDHLFQMKVLSRREYEDISFQSGVSKMNDALLQLISRKSSEQFVKFKEALNSTSQEHVVKILKDWEIDDKEYQTSMVVKHKNRNADVLGKSREEDSHSHLNIFRQVFYSHLCDYSEQYDACTESEEEDDNSYTPHPRDVFTSEISSSPPPPHFEFIRIQARSLLIKRKMSKHSEKLKELDYVLQKEVSRKLACLDEEHFGEGIDMQGIYAH